MPPWPASPPSTASCWTGSPTRSCSPRPPPASNRRPWEPDEGATASINYTSGTTARPKGVQLTHRNCWLNAAIFGWHVAVTDRDAYMHTLPMFHCNGWGMPYAVTAMGVPQVVVRKIDGEEILRRIDAPRCHPAVRGPGSRGRRSRRRCRQAAKGEDVPGRGRTRIVVAGAPPPSKTIERVETELGWEFIQIYGSDRDLAAADDQPGAGLSGMGSTPADRARLQSQGGRPGAGGADPHGR